MSAVLVLGTSKGLDRMGRGRVNGFGPGSKAAVLLDVVAFERLVAASGSPYRLAGELRQPLVVLVEDHTSEFHLRRITSAGGICVPPDCRELLPVILQRLTQEPQESFGAKLRLADLPQPQTAAKSRRIRHASAAAGRRPVESTHGGGAREADLCAVGRVRANAAQ